jgi:hypothetical protein
LIVLPNANRIFPASSLNLVTAVKKHIFTLGSFSLILDIIQIHPCLATLYQELLNHKN